MVLWFRHFVPVNVIFNCIESKLFNFDNRIQLFDLSKIELKLLISIFGVLVIFFSEKYSLSLMMLVLRDVQQYKIFVDIKSRLFLPDVMIYGKTNAKLLQGK